MRLPIGIPRRDRGRPRLARAARVGIVAVALIVGAVPFASMSAAGNQTIVIVDSAYRPPDVTVTVGDVFRYQSGQLAHTVTADDGSFDSGEVAPGKTFSHFFDRTGVFTYHCTIHGMTGKLTVVAAGTTPSPTPTPTPVVTAAPPSPKTSAGPSASPTAAPAASEAAASPDPAPDAGASGSISPIAIAGIVGLVLLLVLVLLFVIPAPRGPKGGATG